MKKAILSDTLIAKLPIPPQRFARHRDGVVVGLCVLVTSAGARSFVFRWREAATGRDTTRTLGNFPEMNIRQAREAALLAHLEIGRGGAPTSVAAPARQFISDERRSAIETLYLMGASYAEIHRIVGVWPYTARRYTRLLPPRSGSHFDPPMDVKARVVAASLRGLKVRAVVRQHGLSATYLSRWRSDPAVMAAAREICDAEMAQQSEDQRNAEANRQEAAAREWERIEAHNLTLLANAPERHRGVVMAMARGETFRRAGEAFGYSHTMAQHLKREWLSRGVILPPSENRRCAPSKPWTDKMQRVLEEMAASQEHSAAAIAAVLGVSRSAVFGRALRTGVALRPNERDAAWRKAAVKPKAAVARATRRGPAAHSQRTPEALLNSVMALSSGPPALEELPQNPTPCAEAEPSGSFRRASEAQRDRHPEGLAGRR